MQLLPMVPSLVLVLVLLSTPIDANPRERRQATETTTYTVADTTTIGLYPICVSLINATRPCYGRQAILSPDVNEIHPSAVIKMEMTESPEMDSSARQFSFVTSLLSSFKSPSRQEWFSQKTGDLRLMTNSIINTFLGLTSTSTSYVTETKYGTEYSTIRNAYKYFTVSDCIPANMNFPLCPANLAKEMAI